MEDGFSSIWRSVKDEVLSKLRDIGCVSQHQRNSSWARRSAGNPSMETRSVVIRMFFLKKFVKTDKNKIPEATLLKTNTCINLHNKY